MLLRSPKDAAAGAGAAAAGVVTVVLVALLFAPQVVANNNGVIPLPIYGYGRFPVGIRSPLSLLPPLSGTSTEPLAGSARRKSTVA